MAGRPPLINARELHERITFAAASVFAEKGFDAATIDEIVRRADISKPALYRVYESKGHLYRPRLSKIMLVRPHGLHSALWRGQKEPLWIAFHQ